MPAARRRHRGQRVHVDRRGAAGPAISVIAACAVSSPGSVVRHMEWGRLRWMGVGSNESGDVAGDSCRCGQRRTARRTDAAMSRRIDIVDLSGALAPRSAWFVTASAPLTAVAPSGRSSLSSPGQNRNGCSPGGVTSRSVRSLRCRLHLSWSTSPNRLAWASTRLARRWREGRLTLPQRTRIGTSSEFGTTTAISHQAVVPSP